MARGMSPPRTDSSSPRERDRFANNSYSLVPKLKECWSWDATNVGSVRVQDEKE